MLISDDDGIYYARAWLRAGDSMDKAVLSDLLTWVRSKLPSKLLTLCALQISTQDVLKLLDRAAKP